MLKRMAVLLSGILLLFAVAHAEAANETFSMVVNGKQSTVEPEPFLLDGRVYVPVRFIAEELGAEVIWDEENSTVDIEQNEGDSYLKGQNGTGIMNDLIKPSELKNLLDEDKDNDLADYRQGHSGGDLISNDPLVVDLRKKEEYDERHIPGALWVDVAQNMAEQKNVKKLKSLLDEHVASGGKNEIVLYCYSGNTSALVAGVLGAQGLPVKSMMYGFDIGWRGTKKAEDAIKAPMEDNNGTKHECGG